MIAIAVIFSMCRKPNDFSEDQYDDRLSGGLATAFDETAQAFSHEVDGLSGFDAIAHERGDVAFEQTFVAAPAPLFGGLGPAFNNVSCVSCHHNDSKGLPTMGGVNSALLFRISTGGVNEHGGPESMPGYGGQIQDVALFGRIAEAKITATYTDVTITYADGETVTLRKPSYTLSNLYKPMQGTCTLSPRLAPAIFGLGLLENIPESTLLGFADENDADDDGISGKANYVYNPQTNRTEIGRFGLKANTSTIAVQVATAYQQDMGITSSIHPKESTFGQLQLDGLQDYGQELPDSTLRFTTFYIKTLAVPARRNTADATVKKGQQLFAQMNCNGCHKPVMMTGMDYNVSALSNQRIQPFTDLLLHDMGDGLADNYDDFLANGREWKTTPLWGVGLLEKVNGTAYYLHDGRARSIEEAILWHGGEAEASKDKFVQLSKADRQAVIRFLKSL
jgi:CxxC motif-containing protein (DUF1111 family)